MNLLEEVKTYETLWGEQEALVEKLYRETYMNEREEACIELILRGAYAVAHEELLKLSDTEQANVENNCSFEEWDGYTLWKRGLEDGKVDIALDEIGNYEGTSDK